MLASGAFGVFGVFGVFGGSAVEVAAEEDGVSVTDSVEQLLSRCLLIAWIGISFEQTGHGTRTMAMAGDCAWNCGVGRW
jgi:hypothetical protein